MTKNIQSILRKILNGKKLIYLLLIRVMGFMHLLQMRDLNLMCILRVRYMTFMNNFPILDLTFMRILSMRDVSSMYILPMRDMFFFITTTSTTKQPKNTQKNPEEENLNRMVPYGSKFAHMKLFFNLFLPVREVEQQLKRSKANQQLTRTNVDHQ